MVILVTEPQTKGRTAKRITSRTDAKHGFVGADAPNGPTALQAHWTESEALTVSEGTLLFARQVGIPQKVYALEIVKQGLDRIEARYKVFNGVERLGR